ncbi:MAG: ribonuclease H [Desulfobacca sp.]|nr:ribonuclease H [Desulfobacca sp.]
MPKGKDNKNQGNWHLYTDGASKGNPGPAGAGWMLVNDQDSDLVKDSKFLGEATNNEAEYQALILGLQNAQSLGIREIKIYMDSELLVRQLTGLYRVKNPRLMIYYQQVRDLLKKFSNYAINHIPREQNREADAMANEAIRKQKGSG